MFSSLSWHNTLQSTCPPISEHPPLLIIIARSSLNQGLLHYQSLWTRRDCLVLFTLTQPPNVPLTLSKSMYQFPLGSIVSIYSLFCYWLFLVTYHVITSWQIDAYNGGWQPTTTVYRKISFWFFVLFFVFLFSLSSLKQMVASSENEIRRRNRVPCCS